jgi:hypothetical protein
MDYRTYGVSRRAKEPLLKFILDALEGEGCRILLASDAARAPFRITFETTGGERLGVVVYAFFANKNNKPPRPTDEHRFQVKYGPNDKDVHPIWQDPYLLYTTLFCGIDPERSIFVGADPVLHSPTPFFMSIEYKDQHVEEILKTGWHAWERDRHAGDENPIEVLVGGTAKSFLRYVRFEREALGEDQGHRQLLADQADRIISAHAVPADLGAPGVSPNPDRLHALAKEFEMSEVEVLDLISKARRLKMAVRGWVAEEHLVRTLGRISGVSDCFRSDEEGGPDVRLKFEGTALTVECKNVLRKRAGNGAARMDFQRTRASKNDPCSRYYAPEDFNVLAACLHAVKERWVFSYIRTASLQHHKRCPGKLSNNVLIDDRWSDEASEVLAAAAAG